MSIHYTLQTYTRKRNRKEHYKGKRKAYFQELRPKFSIFYSESVSVLFKGACFVIKSPFLERTVDEVVVAPMNGETSFLHLFFDPRVCQQVKQRIVERFLLAVAALLVKVEVRSSSFCPYKNKACLFWSINHSKMLAIFDSQSVPPPPELHSPASHRLPTAAKPKLPHEILTHFSASCEALSMSFGNSASLAFDRSASHSIAHHMLFCGLDEMYCMFKGSLNNLSRLNKQYGLSKATNEAMFVIEAYRTLRDRGPYPADQVLKELEGDFAFVVFDRKTGSVFAALDANEEMNLYWGTAADGSLVISDSLEVIKAGCAKSFAPFPPGCMFHNEKGLMSFEHPTKKMKAMPRIDSEGVMCGANFKVDVQSRVHSMPRVGSEANWATWGPHS